VFHPRRNAGHSRAGWRLAWALGTVTALAPPVMLAAPPAQAQLAQLAPLGGTQADDAARYAAPPAVSLLGGELVNAGTGATLWSDNANVPRPMGSITKVMTALVVLRAGDLRRKITVSKAAVQYVQQDGASSAGLVAGDVLTARQLLAAMLVPSGCDAAYLLATAYGPGRGAFVQKMTAMAKAMGLTETHFSWFDGMPYPNEFSTYSSPADLIRIGEAAMRNPVFRSIVARPSFYVPPTEFHHSYQWYTTNELIGSYPGALGIKTGNTIAAGNCLLFEAERGRVTLIGVVLHANPSGNPGSAFPPAEQLLNWGFRQAWRSHCYGAVRGARTLFCAG
jgi:serine-type D-Ala-D-Ala carboxypeptidase (penicillin-binding protein 5/6)